MAATRLRAATRGSELAQWQASHVASLLEAAHPGLKVDLIIIETTGDRRRDVPLWEVGGQGIFVKEVQAAVLDGAADFAVHSAKDLMSVTAPGLVMAAVPERADPRDALVGSTFDALPVGARVATGSVRRRAQLAWLRPDLTFGGLRGNIGTRLQRTAEHDAVVIAMAALARLDLLDRLASTVGPWEALEPSVMLPQVGQGALAAECREDDEAPLTLLASVEHPPSRRAVDAERAFLAHLGGGCDLPVGAFARDEGRSLRVEGLIASADGRVLLRHAVTGPAADPSRLGTRLAEELLERGGASVLESRDAPV
jgi:hydroxymethylbilane synthase